MARRQLLAAAREAGKPVIHGAVLGRDGQLTTILPGDNPVFESEYLNQPAHSLRTSTGGGPQRRLRSQLAGAGSHPAPSGPASGLPWQPGLSGRRHRPPGILSPSGESDSLLTPRFQVMQKCWGANAALARIPAIDRSDFLKEDIEPCQKLNRPQETAQASSQILSPGAGHHWGRMIFPAGLPAIFSASSPSLSCITRT